MTEECWIPPKNDTSHPRAKGQPQQDSRWVEVAFRIIHHTHQRHKEGSNQSLSHQVPGTKQKTEPDLPLSVWVSSGEAQFSNYLMRGQGLWLQQVWWMHSMSATIELLSRQQTNWRTTIPKKFSDFCENSRAHTDFST